MKKNLFNLTMVFFFLFYTCKKENIIRNGQNEVSMLIDGLITLNSGIVVEKEEMSSFGKEIYIYHLPTRPHSSIDFLTPEQAHQCSGPLKKHWKSKTERRKNKVCITGLELPDLYV